MKNQYRGLGQFIELMGVGLSKKEGVVFLRGRGVDTPMHTMIYLLKANNRNNRKRCEICSKFTVKKKNNKRTSLTLHWCFYC